MVTGDSTEFAKLVILGLPWITLDCLGLDDVGFIRYREESGNCEFHDVNWPKLIR